MDNENIPIINSSELYSTQRPWRMRAGEIGTTWGYARTIPVYDSSYTLMGSYSSRAKAMDVARRLAGGEQAECRIVRDGDAVVAVYSGPRGQYAAADGARPVFLDRT